MKFFEDGRRSSESHHSTLVELDYVEGSWLVSPGGTRTTSTSRKQPGAQQCTRVCRRTALERFVAGTTTQGLMALFHEMWSLTCTSARDVLSWVTERLPNHTGQDYGNHSSHDGLQILGHCGTGINSTIAQDTSTGISINSMLRKRGATRLTGMQIARFPYFIVDNNSLVGERRLTIEAYLQQSRDVCTTAGSVVFVTKQQQPNKRSVSPIYIYFEVHVYTMSNAGSLRYVRIYVRGHVMLYGRDCSHKNTPVLLIVLRCVGKALSLLTKDNDRI